MSDIDEPIRWGILGTAGIAESAFLPALRETNEGVALTVGSRTLERGRAWAEEHGVTRAVEGYDAVIADPEVEAIYIPLPNGLHAEWTIAALEAGKVVLCEKPLCGTVEDTERVLAAARATGVPLWEAFVFPFHEQMDLVRAMLADGTIGTVREIQSRFHFVLDDPDDIRSVREPGGRLDPGRRLLPDPAGAVAVRRRARPLTRDRRRGMDRGRRRHGAVGRAGVPR